MDDIGIRMTFDKVEKLPDLRKQAQLGKMQCFTYGWIADYPDGENFLQLFMTQVHRRRELHDVQLPGVRPPLRAGEDHARLARAHRALPPHGAHPLGLRPVAGELPDAQHDPDPARG